MYADFKYDIQPLNGVMVEKFVPPTFENEYSVEWLDIEGNYHSYNGMPAFIRHKGANVPTTIAWFIHGKIKKHFDISQKMEHEIIAEKRKNRTFVKRKLNDKNRSSNK